MKNAIRLPFLLASLAVFLVLGVAVYFLHELQLYRQSVFMLARARQAKDEKQFQPAVRDYQTYLLIAPKDADARAELGLLLADSGNPKLRGAACAQLEAALRLVPQREDLRRRLAQLDMDSNRYSDARDHLQLLVISSDTDDNLWEQLGVCQAALGDDGGASGHPVKTRPLKGVGQAAPGDGGAIESFQKAIRLNPARCKSYAGLAWSLGRLDRSGEADEWMAKLVATNPESAEAHVLLARYLAAQAGKQEKALLEAKEAARLAPGNFEFLLLAANLAGAAGDYKEARGYAERAIAAQPTQAAGYGAIFQLEMRQGEQKEAMAALHRGIDKAADPESLLWDRSLILIQQGDLDEARRTIARLGKSQDQSVQPAQIEFLQAAIEAAQGNWSAAAEKFAAVAQQLQVPNQVLGSTDVQGTLANELFKDAECRLALCYQKLGDADAQLAAFQRAVRADPLWSTARMGVADALASLGRINEALAEYRQVRKLPNMATAADIHIARLLLAKNLRSRSPDWKEAEEVFDHLKAAKADSAEITILLAEMRLAQGRGAEAEQQLIAARDKQPDSIECWTALIDLAQRQHQLPQAAELLAQAEKKFGDGAWIRLAQARQLLASQDTKAEAAPAAAKADAPAATIAGLERLGEDSAKFSVTDRVRLHLGLALCLGQAGDLQRAKAQAALACAADPSNLESRLLLFDMAAQDGDVSAMQKVQDDILGFQGKSAIWNYGEAELQLVLAQRSQDRGPFLEKAFALLATAEGQRPNWGRIPLLRARLYDLQGQVKPAIENYLKAINAGEIDTPAVRRAFELLYSQQRFAEADALLLRLEHGEAAISPEEMGRMASAVSMRMDNADRALAIARRVAEQSNDWADHLWLGEVVALLGSRAAADQKPKEAKDYFAEGEKAFRRAVQLSPHTAEAWVGLIRFLVLSGQKDKAAATLAEAKGSVSGEKAAIALAPCYEMLGRTDEASAAYQRLLAAGGNDPLVLRQAAAFCLRTNKPLEAEKHLQKLLALGTSAKPEDIAWARRALAEVFRARGGYANLLKAEELVDQNLAGGSAPEDIQLKALLLATFPQRAKRIEAIDDLQKLIATQVGDSADARFELASLYLREKNWPECNKQMLALVSSHGKEPRYVATYVALLLNHDELDDAGLWLDRLDELLPGNPMNLELRVELLVRRHQADRAIHLVEENQTAGSGESSGVAPAEVKDRRIMRSVGMLISAAKAASQRNDRAADDLLAAAEKELKDYLTRHPAQRCLLASVRMSQGKADEALAIAEESWTELDAKLLDPELAQWVSGAKLTAEQSARLDRLLQAVADKQGRPMALLQALGDLRMKFRRQDAVAIYREILQRDTDNPAALNNLALVLAVEKRDGQESLKLIDRAIAIAGPVAAFLDTRAVALLAGGQPQQALADLDRAIRDEPRPSRYYHQALAYWQLGQKKEANDAFLKARNLGLNAEDLVGQERADYEDLAHKLGQ